MSDPQATPEEISKLVRAARISRLIWIDDKFGTRDIARLARTIATKIDVFWALSPQAQLPHPRLCDIPVGSDPQSIDVRVLRILQEMRCTPVVTHAHRVHHVGALTEKRKARHAGM